MVCSERIPVLFIDLKLTLEWHAMVQWLSHWLECLYLIVDCLVHSPSAWAHTTPVGDRAGPLLAAAAIQEMNQ